MDMEALVMKAGEHQSNHHHSHPRHSAIGNEDDVPPIDPSLVLQAQVKEGKDYDHWRQDRLQ